MGYFESDALEMLEVYLLETRQLNGQLAEILLEAEREGRFSESSIHSISGSCIPSRAPPL